MVTAISKKYINIGLISEISQHHSMIYFLKRLVKKIILKKTRLLNFVKSMTRFTSLTR
jgi:hypothetical protein